MDLCVMVTAPGRQTLSTTVKFPGEQGVAERVASMVKFALDTYGTTRGVTIKIDHLG